MKMRITIKMTLKLTKKKPRTYPEMRGQRELTIVVACTFAYTSG